MVARAIVLAVSILLLSPSVKANSPINEYEITTQTGTGTWGDPFVRTTIHFRTGDGSKVKRIETERGEDGAFVISDPNGEPGDYEDNILSKWELKTKDYTWNRAFYNDWAGTNVVTGYGGYKNDLRLVDTYDDAWRIVEQMDLTARNYSVDVPAITNPPAGNPVDATELTTGADYLDLKQWDSIQKRYREYEDNYDTNFVTSIKTGTEIARTESPNDPMMADVTTKTFAGQWDPLFQLFVQNPIVTTMSTEYIPPPAP